MSYTPIGYCTETDVENFLLLDIDNTFSPQITDWIAAAEQTVNQYTGYNFPKGMLSESITNEVVDGHIDDDLNLLWFPRKAPIQSISKLELIKGTATIDITLTTGEGTPKYNIPSSADRLYYPNWELAITGSIIRNFAQLKAQRFFIRTAYVGGYTTVPADVRMATVYLVADIVTRQYNKENLEMMSQGRVMKRWRERDGRSEYYKDAITILNNYRMAHRWILT